MTPFIGTPFIFLALIFWYQYCIMVIGLSLEDACVVAFALGLAWEIKDVWKDDGFGIKDLSLDGAAIGLYWKIHLGKKKH